MLNTITIDATSARSSFFSILNNVFADENLIYEVKKSGIPVAVITKLPPAEKKDIMSFAGKWSEHNKVGSDKENNDFADEMVKNIYSDRSNSKKTRFLPKI